MERKRKHLTNSGGRKSKRLHKLVEDGMLEDEESSSDNEEYGPSYQIKRFIEHRLSEDPEVHRYYLSLALSNISRFT